MNKIRVLGIQHRSRSPEATVFATLLSAMQRDEGMQPRCVFTVVQFDDEASLAYGEKSLKLPDVQMLSAPIGGSLGFPARRSKKILMGARLLLALPGIVVRSLLFRPDVIYTSQQRWDVRMGVLLSFFLRKPHIIHLHYMPGPWLGKEAFWRLKHCARVVCVSEFIARKAVESGVPAQRVVAIRNVLPAASVELESIPAEPRKNLCEELQISETDMLVGMTARLNPSKGQRELVQAMAPLLAEPESHSQLILAGGVDDPGGTYVQDLFQLVKDQGLEQRVHWLGPRSDVPALLRAFDVFAHPSFNDPCPLAVLEALLAGLPTVVWKEGGSAEMVIDGQTGFTVETGSIEALSAALRRLCTDRALRESMRQHASADAARLADVSSAARRFSAVFADVIASQDAR